MSVITATAPQTRTVRSSGLLKLTATELKLLSRERVRAVLPVAIPLLYYGVLPGLKKLASLHTPASSHAD